MKCREELWEKRLRAEAIRVDNLMRYGGRLGPFRAAMYSRTQSVKLWLWPPQDIASHDTVEEIVYHEGPPYKPGVICRVSKCAVCQRTFDHKVYETEKRRDKTLQARATLLYGALRTTRCGDAYEHHILSMDKAVSLIATALAE